MSWTPTVARHRADAPADSGASAYTKQQAWRDVWAADRDVAKNWGK